MKVAAALPVTTCLLGDSQKSTHVRADYDVKFKNCEPTHFFLTRFSLVSLATGRSKPEVFS